MSAGGGARTGGGRGGARSSGVRDAVRRAAGSLPRPLGALALLGLALALSAGSVEGQGPLEGLRRGMRSQAAFTKGQALYERRDYRGAHEQLVTAVTLDPTHDEALALLGWCQYFLGEYRAAGITFKAALRRALRRLGRPTGGRQ